MSKFSIYFWGTICVVLYVLGVWEMMSSSPEISSVPDAVFLPVLGFVAMAWILSLLLALVGDERLQLFFVTSLGCFCVLALSMMPTAFFLMAAGFE